MAEMRMKVDSFFIAKHALIAPAANGSASIFSRTMKMDPDDHDFHQGL
jgi:hypothetical protein